MSQPLLELFSRDFWVWYSLIHSPALTHLVAIVGPWAKGKVALLPVKREVGDVHYARALSNGRRVPYDLPVVTQLHIGTGITGRLLVCSALKWNMFNPFMHFRKTMKVFVHIVTLFWTVSYHWLVVEDNIWFPNQVAGDVYHLQVVVLFLIPLQVRIVPHLSDPQICGQHLVPLILHTFTHMENIKKMKILIFVLQTY